MSTFLVSNSDGRCHYTLGSVCIISPGTLSAVLAITRMPTINGGADCGCSSAWQCRAMLHTGDMRHHTIYAPHKSCQGPCTEVLAFTSCGCAVDIFKCNLLSVSVLQGMNLPAGFTA